MARSFAPSGARLGFAKCFLCSNVQGGVGVPPSTGQTPADFLLRAKAFFLNLTQRGGACMSPPGVNAVAICGQLPMWVWPCSCWLFLEPAGVPGEGPEWALARTHGQTS